MAPLSPAAVAAAEEALSPFDGAECLVVTADWTSPPDALTAPRQSVVDDARDAATASEPSTRPAAQRVEDVQLALWDTTVRLRPEREVLRELLETAYVLDGWKGVNEVILAARGRVEKLQRLLAPPSTRVLPGAVFTAGRGDARDYVRALQARAGDAALAQELPLAERVVELLPELRLALGDDVYHGIKAVEDEAKRQLVDRLRRAAAEVRKERQRYGVTTETIERDAEGLSPITVHHLGDTDDSRGLKAALGQLAAIRRESLEPLEREQAFASFFDPLLDLAALMEFAEKGQFPWGDPFYRQGKELVRNTAEKRREALTNYLTVRAALAEKYPVIHRIAERVDSESAPNIAFLVGDALAKTKAATESIAHDVETRTALTDSPPSADGPAEPDERAAFYLSRFRTVWRYPAVIYAAADALRATPESLAGAAARRLLDAVDPAREALEYGALGAELLLTVGARRLPIINVLVSGFYVVEHLITYENARQDYLSALNPLHALSEEDPSVLELLANVLIEVAGGL